MKKINLSIIFALLVIQGFSQVRFGVKASFGPSWFGVKEEALDSGEGGYVGGRGKFSFSAGAFTNIKIYKGFSVQPEVLFTRVSSTRIYKYVMGNQFSLTESSTININQIQIPINLRIESKRVYFMAGPSYSVMFSNSNQTGPMIAGSTTTNEVKYNKPDIGLNMTLGIKANEHISVDARFYSGFNKMDNIGYKQQFVHIGASYTF